MTKYVIGTIEPVFGEGYDEPDEKGYFNQRFEDFVDDIERATLYETYDIAMSTILGYFDIDDNENNPSRIFYDELCIYEVDVKVKEKKQLDID